MTEAEWCATVVQIARLHGWRVSHQRPARTEQGWRTAIQGDRGAPDLLLARDGVVLLVELKSDRGRLGPGQAEWLAAAAAHAVVWRPRDLPAVVEALKRPQSRAGGDPAPTTLGNPRARQGGPHRRQDAPTEADEQPWVRLRGPSSSPI